MTSAELIRRVWPNPALWCRKDRAYRNKALKEMLWQKIANELGASVKVCQVKWKSLRDRYAREIKKEQKDPAAFARENKWLYFDRLHFLKDTLCPRATLPKLTPEEWQGQSIQKQEFDASDFIEELPTEAELEEYEDTTGQTFAEKSINGDQPQQRSTSVASSLTDLPSGFRGFFEELATLIKKRQEDECDIFGRLVAAKLRQIPELRRTNAEGLILKCLNDEIEENILMESNKTDVYKEYDINDVKLSSNDNTD